MSIRRLANSSAAPGECYTLLLYRLELAYPRPLTQTGPTEHDDRYLGSAVFKAGVRSNLRPRSPLHGSKE